MQMINGLDDSLAQLVRYGLVGVAVNLSGYLIFVAVTSLGMEPKLAMTVLYLCGVAAGFWGNRKWTFRERGRLFASALKYLGAHAVGYLLNLAILLVFVDRFKYSPRLVQFIAVFAVAGFLFIAFKYFVFVHRSQAREDCQ
jgi:putative flippase GtrA